MQRSSSFFRLPVRWARFDLPVAGLAFFLILIAALGWPITALVRDAQS
jgi:hypothetical protein